MSNGLTLTVALWVTLALVLLAAVPTTWVLTREWLRRRASTLALARVEEARLLADGALDTAVPELARLLTARFDAQTVERAVTGLLGDADATRKARAVALFAELKLDEVFIARLREGVKWTERTRAAEVLGAAGLSSAVPALVQVLRDRYEDETSVKISAAAALAKLRDGSAIPLLVTELKDADERATRNVGEALVAFGAAAVPALMELLEEGTAGGATGATGARVWAAQILGRIADGRATDLLVARLHDRDDRLRMVAAEALGSIGDARAIGAIVRATLRDPAPQVRAHAAGALARLEGERAIDVLVAALADPDYATRLRALEAFETIRVVDTTPLESSLRDANPEVRRRAALALERVGYLEARVSDLTGADRAGRARAYEALLELGRVGLADSVVAYVNHPSFEVRATAARAAGELGSTRSIPLLTAALDDEMWPVRAAAAESLGRLEAEDAVAKLVARLADGEEAVREAAAEALTAFAPAQIEPHAAALVEAYDHGSVTVRTHAVVVLDRLTAEGAAVAEVLLVRATLDPSDTVRLRAVTALGARGGEARVQPLLARLTDGSLEVRMAAVAAFGAEATHEAFEGLLRALAGSSPEMRDRIADALSQSERSEHSRGVRGPLFARLDEIERTATVDVKLGIAWTLGRTGHVNEEASVRTLTRFLAGKDAKLRASAAGALAKIPGARSVTALLTAENDPDDHVRAAVMNALGQNPMDPRVAAALERRLRDPDAFVRNRALVMLARVGGPAVYPRIVALAPQAMPEAGWVALALVGTEEALAQVLAAVADAGTLGRIVRFVAREHPEVRAAFFAALRLEDPDPQATAGEIDRAMQATYEQLLRTSLDVEARRLAVKAVGRTSRATSVEPLADALTGDPDESVRVEAAAALASRAGDARARKALARAIADPSAEVAMRAAHALASRPEPEVTAALLARLGAGAPEVQAVVEQMIADRYRDDPFPLLDHFMGNDVPALLVPGIRVMARMARVETLPLLQSLARGSVAVVRAAAVRALAALPLPEAARSVDGLLLDPQEDVRIAVLEALMMRGDALVRTASLRRDPALAVRVAAVRAIEEQAVRAGAVLPGTYDALAAMLEDTAPPVRAAALVSLLGLPGDEGLQRFARAFALTALDVRLALREEPRVAAISARLAAGLRTRTEVGLRAATVLALGAMGAPGWAPLVAPALRDPAPAVRIAALQALAQVDDEELRARCAELLRDPDLTVREAARRTRLQTA